LKVLPSRPGLDSLCISRLPVASFCCETSRNIAASSRPCGMLAAAAMAMESINCSKNTGSLSTCRMMLYSNAAFQAWNLVVSSDIKSGIGCSAGSQIMGSDPLIEYAMQITSVLGSRA